MKLVAAMSASEEEAAEESQICFEGLADAWDKKASLRRYVIRSKSLLQWLGPHRVGVVTMNMLKLNVPITMALLKIYLPQSKGSKTCTLDNKLKEEVGCLECLDGSSSFFCGELTKKE